MKRKSFINFVIIALAILSSCKTSSIYMNVMQPAQISVPKDIKNIGFINRSIASKEKQVRNIVEGFLTEEGIFADRFGSEECLKGVVNSLSNNGVNRYQAHVVTGYQLDGTGTKQWGPMLDWSMVKKICEANKIDALIILEAFDSDNRVSIAAAEKEQKVKESIVKFTEFTANLEVKVETGWRIYDPKNQKIIDQNIFIDHKGGWMGKGGSEKNAIAALPPKIETVKETGYYAGSRYASRISPTWISVSRMYYRKGHDDFKAGERFIKMNEWEEAGKMFIKHTNSPNRKIAGRACYNMALVAEMQDKMNVALDWAKKAYTQYGDKNAPQYVNVLENRIANIKKLQDQL